jgi:hypothetical protein
VPGPIQEATLLATRLGERKAAHVFPIGKVTPEALVAPFGSVLAGTAEREAMVERAHSLVTGGGGVMTAARLVLEVAARSRVTSPAGG